MLPADPSQFDAQPMDVELPASLFGIENGAEASDEEIKNKKGEIVHKGTFKAPACMSFKTIRAIDI